LTTFGPRLCGDHKRPLASERQGNAGYAMLQFLRSGVLVGGAYESDAEWSLRQSSTLKDSATIFPCQILASAA